jgi:uncharacterized protein YxjI
MRYIMKQKVFDIHIDGQGNLEAQGDLSDHEYSLNRDGELVARARSRTRFNERSRLHGRSQA